MNLSGKSASHDNPIGSRRRDHNGKERAPRSLRSVYPLLADCPRKYLVKIAKIIQDRRRQRRQEEQQVKNEQRWGKDRRHA